MVSTEEPWTNWLCDLEADDYSFINSCVDETLASHNDIDIVAAPNKPPQENNNSNSSKRSFSTDSTMSNISSGSGDDNTSFERPTKTLKTSTSSNSISITGYFQQKNDIISTPPPSSCYILSFNTAANPATPMLNADLAARPKGSINKVVVNNHGRSSSFPAKGSLENQKKEPRRSNSSNQNKTSNNGSAANGSGRSPQHAHDHIIAERMRREKISQQFIALSALIPGLKKMDKATVLGDAIKYVKQLQEQVKMLEDEQAKRKSVETVVYVEKSKVYGAEEDVSDTNSSNSGDGNSYEISRTNRCLPEVEARVSEKNVLIRIHCEKHKGLLMNILREIEKLHLSVINSSALLFGSSIVDITITAEMDDGYRLSVKELARNLRGGLMQFM